MKQYTGVVTQYGHNMYTNYIGNNRNYELIIITYKIISLLFHKNNNKI